MGSSVHNRVTVLVLAATVVIIPKASPYNHVLLLPGIVMLLRDVRAFWNRGLIRRALVSICGLILLWPWLAALVLFASSIFLPADSIQKAWTLPLYPSIAIPVVVPALLACSLADETESA